MNINGWTVRDKVVELPGALVETGDRAPKCPLCRSSQVWPLGWVGRLLRLTPRGCIQPACDGWWQRG